MPNKRSLIYLFFFLFNFSFNHINGQEICNDGIDNDFDGLVDCYDDDCTLDGNCDGFFFNTDLPSCQLSVPQGNFNIELVGQSDASLYPFDQRATPMVGDMNNDGIPDIVAKNKSGNVYIFTGNNLSDVTSFSSKNSNAFSSLAIADVDDDGTGEIFYVGNDKKMYRYEHDGTKTFNSTSLTPSNVMTTQIADFNQDGTPEVYAGTVIFNAIDGSLLVDGSISTPAPMGGHSETNIEPFPIAVDILTSTDIIDGGSPCGSPCDGLELLAGNTVFAIDISTNTITAATTSGLGDGPSAIADFDNDGDLDGIIVSDGTVYIWDLKTGNQLFTSYTIPNTTKGGRPNVADFDNDGFMEIGIAGKNRYMVLDTIPSGTLDTVWTKTGLDDGSQRTGSSVFDFEGDGINEVIYSDEENLYIFNGATGEIVSQITSRAGTRFEYPVIADVNADGQTEILMPSQDTNGSSSSGTNYFNLYKSTDKPWVRARAVWNQHGYMIANINDDLTVPRVQQNTLNSNVSHRLNGFLNQASYYTIDGDYANLAPDVSIAPINRSTDIGYSNCTLKGEIDITLTIDNSNGDLQMAKGSPISFYDDNPYLVNATLFDTIHLPETIPAGSSLTFTASVFINSNSSLDLYVLSNDNGYLEGRPYSDLNMTKTGIGECDYTNNMNIVNIDPCKMSSLPIELTLFNVKAIDKIALLEWSTTSEINNRGFEIEHLYTETNHDFFKIGFVKGVGNSDRVNHYNFSTDKLLSGIHYFRLKQIDTNGEFSFSQIKTIEIADQNVVQIYPSLLKSNTSNLNIKTNLKEEYTVRLIDTNGSTINTIHHKQEEDSSFHTISMQFNGKAKGLYFISLISTRGFHYTEKIIYQP